MRGDRKTVLVVEDHPRLRAGIRRVLVKVGLEAVEAADATSALFLLETMEPALVIADLALPDSSGYELCEQIRSLPKHAKTPILVLSERAYPEDRAHAADAGADAFLAKPFDDQQLRARVEALLASAPAAIAS